VIVKLRNGRLDHLRKNGLFERFDSPDPIRRAYQKRNEIPKMLKMMKTQTGMEKINPKAIPRMAASEEWFAQS
jgi:hypothetical protein